MKNTEFGFTVDCLTDFIYHEELSDIELDLTKEDYSFEQLHELECILFDGGVKSIQDEYMDKYVISNYVRGGKRNYLQLELVKRYKEYRELR